VLQCRMRCKMQCKMRAQPDWLKPGTWIFVCKPCFLSYLQRGNSPFYSSLKNQAFKRNNILGYIIYKSYNILYFTIFAFQATIRGFISINLLNTSYPQANWTSLANKEEYKGELSIYYLFFFIC